MIDLTNKIMRNYPSSVFIFGVHVLMLFFLPYSLPLFIYSFIAYGFGRAMGLLGARAIACGFCIWLGLNVSISHLLARHYLYGFWGCFIILLISIFFSIMILITKRTFKSERINRQNFSYKDIFISILPILVLFAIFFIHNRIFWIAKHFNGPYSNFIQTAQYLIREKGIHFLTQNEDVYDTYQSWYPPLMVYLITPARLMFRNQTLFVFSSILSPYIFSLGIAVFLSLFEENKFNFLIASWLIISIFCTYSWFTLISEISTDTLAFLILSSFLVLLVSIYQKPNIKFTAIAILMLIPIFWFRQFAGPIIILSIPLLLFIKRLRANFLAKTKYILLFFGLFIIVLVLANLWYVDVYRITGSPLYPVRFQKKFLKIETKPDWMNKDGPLSVTAYNIEDKQRDISIPEKISLEERLNRNLLTYEFGWLYNFFSLDKEAVIERTIIKKFLRGFIFGYTFPSAISILIIIGIFFYIFRKKDKNNLNYFRNYPNLLPSMKISLCVIVAFFVFIAINNFYFKLLYLVTPFLLIFAFYALIKFTEGGNRIKFIQYLAYLQLIIFIFLVLYKSVGTTGYPWAIPKYILNNDKEAYNSFKAYYLYESAMRARERLKNKDVKIMHFHPEPGIQASLYLDRNYYWEEEHYHNNRKFMDLYRCQTQNKLIKLLREKNIRVFVVTGLNKSIIDEWVNYDYKAKHLLPKLLINKNNAFEFDGQFAYLKE